MFDLYCGCRGFSWH